MHAFHSIAALCLFSVYFRLVQGFVSLPQKQHQQQQRSFEQFQLAAATVSSNLDSVCSIKSYEHDGWKLTYRYKPASSGYEKHSPVLLVHPVGIGLSSWFWEKLLENWTGPAVYAPSLIGCGIREGGDPWKPDERGLFFPLSWTKGCEALMNIVISKRQGISNPFNKNSNNSKSFVVVAQGGLATVGIQLAYRNPDLVNKLVLTSPPTWKDLTIPVPESELERNYNFLKNPIWGKLAFDLLESRGAVEFFSNAFLFSEPCDQLWLDKAEGEACPDARPPVMAFNAGLCEARSFLDELQGLEQPTQILIGEDDKRKRDEYPQKMKNCELLGLPGQNVLPWESSTQMNKALLDFIAR